MENGQVSGGMSMTFFTPSFNLERWKMLLADPEKHWREHYSAYELAHAWANVKDLPVRVKEAFDRSGIDDLRHLKVLLKIPVHPVTLDNANAPSMNDLFVLARSDSSLYAIMVEGKVNEPFGLTVEEWEDSDGKRRRLNFLMETLGLKDRAALNPIRYQLLHRTASAVIEARRYHAGRAMMLVHSFSPDGASFGDYAAFLGLYGLQAEPNAVVTVPEPVNGVTLHLGWVSDAHG
jgi:hypothetical protein